MAKTIALTQCDNGWLISVNTEVRNIYDEVVSGHHKMYVETSAKEALRRVEDAMEEAA